MGMIETHCSCGELVNVEIGRKDVCRADGKRPHHLGTSITTTQFRCKKCKGWLADTCADAQFGLPIRSIEEGEINNANARASGSS